MRYSAILLGTLLLAGCGTVAGPAPDPYENMSVRHGQSFAEVRCAPCHAIEIAQTSPRPDAPSFRILAVRFNTITWRRVLTEIAAGAHAEMPAIQFSEGDIEDLEAYIRVVGERR